MKEEYLNNINLELHTQVDVENLLKEYESGNLTRDEYICCSWLAHSITNSNGFRNGYKARDKKPPKPKVYKCANCGKNYSQIFSFYCQDCLL